MTVTADEARAADRALALLREHSRPDPDGYVTLNTVPYRAHHLLLSEVLRLTAEGDEIFEGGVSSGYFAEAVAAAGRTVDGHELDPVAAAAARGVCREVWEGDLQTFDPDTAGVPTGYSLLLFGDTLEHIADPVAVLDRLAGRLRPGGRLVISVPNVANWSVRLGLLLGRFDYTERGILDRTHVRFYTRRTLVRMVEQAGFVVDRVQAAVPVPGVTARPLARLTHRLGNLLPGVFAYNFVVSASRPQPMTATVSPELTD